MAFTLFPESLLRESYSHKAVTVKNEGVRAAVPGCVVPVPEGRLPRW
jgi:hypothetical protein